MALNRRRSIRRQDVAISYSSGRPGQRRRCGRRRRRRPPRGRGRLCHGRCRGCRSQPPCPNSETTKTTVSPSSLSPASSPRPRQRLQQRGQPTLGEMCPSPRSAGRLAAPAIGGHSRHLDVDLKVLPPSPMQPPARRRSVAGARERRIVLVDRHTGEEAVDGRPAVGLAAPGTGLQDQQHGRSQGRRAGDRRRSSRYALSQSCAICHFRSPTCSARRVTSLVAAARTSSSSPARWHEIAERRMRPK